MSVTGVNRVYGHEGLKFGHTIASIDIRSHDDARLLERILRKAMQDTPGGPHEARLAQWHNDLAKTRERAIREKWIGWHDEEQPNDE